LDLTPIVVIIGTTACPSPKGEGMGLISFLVDGVDEFLRKIIELRMYRLLPPWGRRERGLWTNPFLDDK